MSTTALVTVLGGCGDGAILPSGSESSEGTGTTQTTAETSEASSNADTSASSTGITTTVATETTTTDDTTTGTTTADTTGTDAESSSTGVSQGCDDGLTAPGEVCLEPVVLSGDAVEGGRGLAAGDVDSDGDIDLFTASQLLRNEGGAFEPETPYPIAGSGYPAAGALGDGDDLDVVVPSDVVAWVLIGDGTGTLTPDIELPMPDFTYAVAIGDAVGDAQADVVAVSLGGDARIFEGAADDAFTPLASDSIASELRDVAAGDIDGDGRVDFVAGSYDIGAHVFVGGAWIDWPGSAGYQQIALGDLDEDGNLDVVGTLPAGGNEDVGALDVQRGDGDGGSLDITTIDLPLFTRAIAVADVDGDGHLDLVAPSYSDVVQQVAILLGAGDGTFAEPLILDAPVHAFDIIAVELNGDDSIDFAIYGTASGEEGSSGGEALGPVMVLLSHP